MTDHIKCPYCKGEMVLKELGVRRKIYFYECAWCLSRSPMTWNKFTANSMAKMRDAKKVI